MTTTVAVRERPILLSGAMVRAIRDEKKTQTRRVVKPQPNAGPTGKMVDLGGGGFGLLDIDLSGEWRCPFGQPGDRLWVRETWFCDDWRSDDVAEVAPKSELLAAMYYRADGEASQQFPEADTSRSPWKPSIHMPRWASRLSLELTGVRVERVQDISPTDAQAEGIGYSETALVTSAPWTPAALVERYAMLWDSLNESRGYGWNVNPWVWVLEFRRAEVPA